MKVHYKISNLGGFIRYTISSSRGNSLFLYLLIVTECWLFTRLIIPMWFIKLHSFRETSQFSTDALWSCTPPPHFIIIPYLFLLHSYLQFSSQISEQEIYHSQKIKWLSLPTKDLILSLFIDCYFHEHCECKILPQLQQGSYN